MELGDSERLQKDQIPVTYSGTLLVLINTCSPESPTDILLNGLWLPVNSTMLYHFVTKQTNKKKEEEIVVKPFKLEAILVSAYQKFHNTHSDTYAGPDRGIISSVQ